MQVSISHRFPADFKSLLTSDLIKSKLTTQITGADIHLLSIDDQFQESDQDYQLMVASKKPIIIILSSNTYRCKIPITLDYQLVVNYRSSKKVKELVERLDRSSWIYEATSKARKMKMEVNQKKEQSLKEIRAMQAHQQLLTQQQQQLIQAQKQQKKVLQQQQQQQALALSKLQQSQQHLQKKLIKDLNISFPDYWHQTQSPNTQAVQLYSVSSNIMSIIKQLVHSTTISNHIGKGRDNLGLSHKSYQVIDVHRIENPNLWIKYTQFKANLFLDDTNKFHSLGRYSSYASQLAEDLDKDINEVYLWHGTKPMIKQIIQSTGFDERVASDGLFGHGIYFAENFSKSDEYVSEESDGIGYIFLTRVCLGNIAHIKNSQGNRKRPPCIKEQDHPPTCNGICSHERYHSLVAAKGPGCYLKKYREFIVYDRNQCYPEYLISYRRI